MGHSVKRVGPAGADVEEGLFDKSDDSRRPGVAARRWSPSWAHVDHWQRPRLLDAIRATNVAGGRSRPGITQHIGA